MPTLPMPLAVTLDQHLPLVLQVPKRRKPLVLQVSRPRLHTALATQYGVRATASFLVLTGAIYLAVLVFSRQLPGRSLVLAYFSIGTTFGWDSKDMGMSALELLWVAEDGLATAGVHLSVVGEEAAVSWLDTILAPSR